ncbi:MAG: hypothetical protein ACTHJ7_00990 [Candidatus Nitrosocosmicus sp.]
MGSTNKRCRVGVRIQSSIRAWQFGSILICDKSPLTGEKHKGRIDKFLDF